MRKEDRDVNALMSQGMQVKPATSQALRLAVALHQWAEPAWPPRTWRASRIRVQTSGNLRAG